MKISPDMLTNASTKASTNNSSNNNDDVKKEKVDNTVVSQQTAELERKLKETEDMLRANSMMMKEYEKSFKEKLQESKQNPLAQAEKFDKTKPHLSNINEDPILTGKVIHHFEDKSIIRVGRKTGNPRPEIIIRAIGIQPNHAHFEIDEEEGVFLVPGSEDYSDQIRINGEPVKQREMLFHLDRIVFGATTAFLFKDLNNADFKRTSAVEKDIDLEFCQKEINKSNEVDEIVTKAEVQNFEKKLIEKDKEVQKIEEQLQEMKIKIENNEMEKERSEREQDYKKIEMEFELKKIQKDLEVEKHKQQILHNEQKKINKQKEKKVLEEKLA